MVSEEKIFEILMVIQFVCVEVLRPSHVKCDQFT